ncbi:MAG: GDSL-type esterase/lipase family protein [Thermodesulfobacteriota bacterium]
MQNILFVGDSLIAYFDWQQRFPEFNCVNLGVPGETVAGCRGQVAQIVGRYPQADFVVVMIGTNNLVMSEFGFLAEYEQLVADLHANYPGATIALCSLLPLQLPWLAPGAVERLNDLLKELAKQDWGVYLDICESFQDEDPVSCFVEDGVHLSNEGYRRWSAVLADWLETLP